MLNKKIIYIYAIFFVCSLTILSGLNFLYKKYVINLKIDTRYDVSAIQFFDFKKKSLNKSLDILIAKINNKYLIENLRIYSDVVTLDPNMKNINFELVVRKNHKINTKEIESELNKIYLGSVNKIINDLEKNINLINPNKLNKEFKSQQYDNLIN